MIFVTVGTHPQSFERLLEKAAELVGHGAVREKVFCQTGFTDFNQKKIKNLEFKNFLGLREFEEKIKEARIVITHAGEGNVGLCLKHKKKMILVPRLKEFAEHINNHQLELAEAVEKSGKGIVVKNVELLEKALKNAEKLKPEKFEKGRIAELIEEFVKKQGLES